MQNQDISFGDRVSICCEKANNFLTSTGVADSRILLTEPSNGKTQSCFERCIFSLEKVKTWNQPSNSTGTSDATEPLMFGNVVQLRHVYSGNVVTVSRRRLPEAKGCVHVSVEAPNAESQAATVFRVIPRYKIRQEGERVSAGDHLILFNEHLRVYISLDDCSRQIIGSSAIESFSFFVFEGAELRNASALRLQTSALLFHKEQESFFQLAQSSAAVSQPVLVHPHIRDSTYTIAALNFSTNALWVFEAVNAAEGGIVLPTEAYRIRHCASARYLAAAMIESRWELSTVDRTAESDGSLWSFVPCESSERVIQSSTTFFRVQNVASCCWLHTTATSSNAGLLSNGEDALQQQTKPSRNPFVSAAQYSGLMTRVELDVEYNSEATGMLSLVERPAYVDVFCAVTAPYEIEKNLHRVLGFKSLLCDLQQEVRRVSREHKRHEGGVSLLADSELLSKGKASVEQLIPFCFHSDRRLSSSPNFVNQRMLVDQDIHTIVLDVLEMILRCEDWDKQFQIVLFVRIAFRLLTAIVKENVVGCQVIDTHMYQLAPYLSKLSDACGLFSEVVRVIPLHQSLVNHIVDLVIPLLSDHESYFTMLQDLCFGGGAPQEANQIEIFNHFLESGFAPKISVLKDSIDVEVNSTVLHIDETRDNDPEGRFCAGCWKLLGCCTVGRPFPPLAWVEPDHVAPLLSHSSSSSVVREAVISVARSVFLSDVDNVEEQHPQLWSWKYRAEGRPATITFTQGIILKETISILESLVTSFESVTSQPLLLNELLVLWNSIVLSRSYTEELAVRLVAALGALIEAIPPISLDPFDHLNSNCEYDSDVLQAVLHALNIIQTLLEHHCANAAKKIRNTIRPQLHEETDEDVANLIAQVREASHSELLCKVEWLPRLLCFAASQSPQVSIASLRCIFDILAPSRVALKYVECSIVFSEGHEQLLGELMQLCHSVVCQRFGGNSHLEVEQLATNILACTQRCEQDLALSLDMQNILLFSGVHAALARFLDAAQNASAGNAIGNIPVVAMGILSFMTLRNIDISRAMGEHLPTLTHLSTLCHNCASYYTLMSSVFATVDEHSDVEVTKLVHDIFAAETLSEPSLSVILQILRCRSDAIRRNGREAAVGAVSLVAFDTIDQDWKPLLLEIICECATPETIAALCRYICIADVLTVLPTAKEFIAAASSACCTFEVCLRCLSALFLRDDSVILPEEAELIKKCVVDVTAEITLTAHLQQLPPITFGFFAQLMKRRDLKSHFCTQIRSIASHVLNHCETSVNTKFQLECREELLAFLDSVEEFIFPESLPNIGVVKRRLQRITRHGDDGSQNGSASSISSHWTRIRHELASELREPSEEDLKPLTLLLSQGTSQSRATVRMIVRHLLHSVLPGGVGVSLLLCLRFLLPDADEVGEQELTRRQNELNSLEATPLLSTLLEKPDFDVVRHAIKFGISLLEGGNKQCQDTLLHYFKTHDEKFFFTIRKYLKLAQSEINGKTPSHEPDSVLVVNSFSAVSQDLCRLLQLLCEGHHFEFQNYVRHQNDNFNSYNMCVLVMELLHAVVLKMDPATLHIAVQALNTLTEFCQGPCQQNQAAIVGCNVVLEVNRILVMSYESSHFNESDVMEMKQAAIVLLLSLLEGSQDKSIPNLILTTIDTSALKNLVDHVWGEYRQANDNESADELLDLGFNIFILAKILISNGDKAKSDTMATVLRDTAGYNFFNAYICNIEIWRDDDPTSLRLETVYFRKPEICRLREETKEAVMNEVDRSSLVSKHSDFCKCADDLIFEMEFQFQIEESARSFNRFLKVVTFNLFKCRPRPVEDVLLLLGIVANLMLVCGFTSREGTENWIAKAAFLIIGMLQFFCSVYLVGVRFVLKLPRLAHRDIKKGEVDPFLGMKTWREKFAHVARFDRVAKVAKESYTVCFLVFSVASLCGVIFSPYFYTFLLSMVTFKAPLLANIVKAITMNGRQLLLTAFLGVISVYFFSVIGYLFFHEHFARPEGGTNCETLLQCFFYSFGQGVRGGGGIGEELKPNEWENSDFFRREAYDTLFFVIVAVIVMNIVFALIVDTFAELRDARKKVEDDMRTTCFVCGIDAATFDREGEGFGPHTKGPHNVWQYLYFLHHLRRKEVCEYTGQESYVASKIKTLDLSFFPVNRSKSLQTVHQAAEEATEDQVREVPSVTSDDVKKIVKELLEEQMKPMRALLQSSVQAGGGSGASASQSGTARGSSLWNKARQQRGSLIRNANMSFTSSEGIMSPEMVEIAEEELTLAPSIAAIATARSTIASINNLLNDCCGTPK